MAQMIKNLGQFAKALEPKVIATLELVAQDVKAEIDDTTLIVFIKTLMIRMVVTWDWVKQWFSVLLVV